MRSKENHAACKATAFFCCLLSGTLCGQSTQHASASLITTQGITSPTVSPVPHSVPHVVQPFFATHNIKQYLRHYLKGK